MKNTYCLLLLIIFCSCNYTTKKMSINNTVLNKPNLFKIEYYKSKEHKAFEVEENPTFTIENKVELEQAINEIKNSDNPEMWKGAGWNIIELHFKDTVIIIKTNNEKIGMRNSGEFYSLPENNFIERNLNKNN